jgi:hypothetical protein
VCRTPPGAGDVRFASRAGGRLNDDDVRCAGHDVPAAPGLPSAHLSEAIAHAVDMPTYLDRRRTEYEWPAMQRSSYLSDDEPERARGGKLGQPRCDVRSTRRGGRVTLAELRGRHLV